MQKGLHKNRIWYGVPIYMPMKLLHRTSLNFFSLAIGLLAVGGCLLYYWIHQQIADEIYEQLDFEIELIRKELADGGTVSFPFVRIENTDLPHSMVSFGDTLIYDSIQHKPEGYYYLTKTVLVDDRAVQIQVMTTYIGWAEYAHMIFFTFLVVAFLFLLFGLLINDHVNRRIWQPFFANVQLLRHFSVSSDTPVQWKSSRITEFSILQDTLGEMTEQSRQEYLRLREFTENASHEIQTPLGIMRSSLEKLSQLKIDREMSASLMDAKRALDRLSAVNKKLLMLARLDNHYFSNQQPVDLSALLHTKLELMEDLFSHKSIRLRTTIQPSVVVQSDPYTAETLILNLLSNMVRYTPHNGEATITLTTQHLQCANEGPPLSFPSQYLFERFKKGATQMQSNGLGLAIVKRVCEVNRWTIEYRYPHQLHQFTITF